MTIVESQPQHNETKRRINERHTYWLGKKGVETGTMLKQHVVSGNRETASGALVSDNNKLDHCELREYIDVVYGDACKRPFGGCLEYSISAGSRTSCRE